VARTSFLLSANIRRLAQQVAQTFPFQKICGSPDRKNRRVRKSRTLRYALSLHQVNYLPQVSLTLADTSVTESTTFIDLPVSPLWVLQSGTMYQLLSVELSFWTWAPTSVFWVHCFSEQYVGTGWPLNFFQ
jgi:hypothetical protein